MAGMGGPPYGGFGGMPPYGFGAPGGRPGGLGGAAAPASAPRSVGPWTEHKTEKGVTYYYNSITKQSTYEMPPEFANLKASPWTEYKTDGGIPYWYNSETKVSVWTEPEEVKLAKAAAKAGPQPGQPQGPPGAQPAPAQQPAQPSGPAAGERPADSQPGAEDGRRGSGPEPGPQRHQWKYDSRGRRIGGREGSPEASAPSRKRKEKGSIIKNRMEETPEVSSHEEAVEHFRRLLADAGVRWGAKWRDIYKDLATDGRYKLLKRGERKQVFEAYKGAVRKADQAEQLQRRLKAKEDFIEMLKAAGRYIKPRSSWEDVKGRFEADPRYRAIDTAREREELFEDYLWEIKRADRELRRQQAAAFRQLLAESAWLTGRSRWVDEEARLMADPRASQMDPEDRKIVFAEFVKELEEKEIAAKAKEREARRQLEKAKKDELRAVLNAMVETTEIHPHTRFRDIESKLTALEAWKSAVEVLGSSKTRDIFDAIVDDVKAVLAADVKVVRAAGAQAKVPVTPTTTAEEWYAAVNAAEGVDEATKASLAVLKERKPLYFDLAFKDYQEAQTEQERAALERKRRREGRFEQYVTDWLHKHKPTDLAWETLSAELRRSSNWELLESDDDRRQVFERAVAAWTAAREASAAPSESGTERESSKRKSDESPSKDDRRSSSKHKRSRRSRSRERSRSRSSSRERSRERSHRKHRSRSKDRHDDDEEHSSKRHKSHRSDRDRDRDRQRDRDRERDRDKDRDKDRDRDRKERSKDDKD